jgi:hypothetical protein
MDAWRLYEDVCLACAGLWTGRAWRNHPGSEEDEDEAEEYGFTDDPVRVRAHGEGIEGRPMTATGSAARSPSYRRASERHFPSPRTAAPSTQDPAPRDAYKDDEEEEGEEDGEDAGDTVVVRDRQSRTTLALLQTFHARTRFWLSRLGPLLPHRTAGESSRSTDTGVSGRDTAAAPEDRASGEGVRGAETVVQLTPRDVLELELSPLSSLDARFVEWLAEEYGAGRAGARVRVNVRRGWRDLLGLVFAAASASSSSTSASS